MQISPNVTLLYERYLQERAGESLTIEEFVQLILIFPAILITQADGHIDTSEMIHLNKLIQFIGANNINLSQRDLKQEIRYLIWNSKLWRNLFLQALKEIIELNNIGQQAVDLMLSAACSSTGSLINNILLKTINPNQNINATGIKADSASNFISDEEKNEILVIIQFLGLDTNPEISEKLNQVLKT